MLRKLLFIVALLVLAYAAIVGVSFAGVALVPLGLALFVAGHLV